DDEAAFAEMKKHFTEKQIVELTVFCGMWNYSNRLCEALHVDLEHPDKRIEFQKWPFLCSPDLGSAKSGNDRASCVPDVRTLLPGYKDYGFISLNSTPPFALDAASASMMVTTTASAGALKFFTTASVMSFTSAFFCSGVRPLTA